MVGWFYTEQIYATTCRRALPHLHLLGKLNATNKMIAQLFISITDKSLTNLKLVLLHPNNVTPTVRGWAGPLLGHVGPAGVMVADPALQAALDHQVGDVLGQEGGGVDEGQARVGLMLPLARESSTDEAWLGSGGQVY